MPDYIRLCLITSDCVRIKTVTPSNRIETASVHQWIESNRSFSWMSFEIVAAVIRPCWIMSRNSFSQRVQVNDATPSQATRRHSLSLQIETLFSYKLQDAFRRGVDDNQWYFQTSLKFIGPDIGTARVVPQYSQNCPTLNLNMTKSSNEAKYISEYIHNWWRENLKLANNVKGYSGRTKSHR